MNDELLAMRLDVLRRSVDEVRSVVEVLKTSREKLTSASYGVRDAWSAAYAGVAKLDDLENLIHGIAKQLDPGDAGQAERAVEKVGELNIDFKSVLDHLSGAKATLDELVGRHVRIKRSLEDQVTETTYELDQDIRELQQKLDGTMEPAAGEHWNAYVTDVLPRAQQLFAEYLDLLGGVLIREGGLQLSALAEICHLGELCALADWHLENELRHCLLTAPTTLALPVGELDRIAPRWPIVRLGFAHWSIWGMPLEGYEFGRLAAAGTRTFRASAWRSELAAFGDEGIRVLIADVIGAWTEGPAYACALCYLQLHPPGTNGGTRVSAQDRAFVVDCSLRMQIVAPGDEDAQFASGGSGYIQFVDKIAKHWQLAEARAAAEPDSRHRLLLELPGRVRDQFGLTKAFKVIDWEAAKAAWAVCGANGAAPPEQTRKLMRDMPPIGIRHIMNAAWWARIEADAADPDEIERLMLREGQAIANAKEGGGVPEKPRARR